MTYYLFAYYLFANGKTANGSFAISSKERSKQYFYDAPISPSSKCTVVQSLTGDYFYCGVAGILNAPLPLAYGQYLMLLRLHWA